MLEYYACISPMVILAGALGLACVASLAPLVACARRGNGPPPPVGPGLRVCRGMGRRP